MAVTVTIQQTFSVVTNPITMVNDCWPTVILKAAGLVRVNMLYLRKILGYLGSNLLQFWESKTQEQKKRLYILTFALFSYIFSTVLEKSVEISWSVDKLHLLKKKTNSQSVALLLYNAMEAKFFLYCYLWIKIWGSTNHLKIPYFA